MLWQFWNKQATHIKCEIPIHIDSEYPFASDVNMVRTRIDSLNRRNINIYWLRTTRTTNTSWCIYIQYMCICVHMDCCRLFVGFHTPSPSTRCKIWCIYICIYVCIYVCAYIYIYIFVFHGPYQRYALAPWSKYIFNISLIARVVHIFVTYWNTWLETNQATITLRARVHDVKVQTFILMQRAQV